MEVEFSTGRLERCFGSLREATREWGPVVAARYIDRIRQIQSTNSFHELYSYRTFRLHPLHGEYSGRFAINLTGRYRLIVGCGASDDLLVVYEVTIHYDD